MSWWGALLDLSISVAFLLFVVFGCVVADKVYRYVAQRSAPSARIGTGVEATGSSPTRWARRLRRIWNGTPTLPDHLLAKGGTIRWK